MWTYDVGRWLWSCDTSRPGVLDGFRAVLGYGSHDIVSVETPHLPEGQGGMYVPDCPTSPGTRAAETRGGNGEISSASKYY